MKTNTKAFELVVEVSGFSPTYFEYDDFQECRQALKDVREMDPEVLVWIRTVDLEPVEMIPRVWNP